MFATTRIMLVILWAILATGVGVELFFLKHEVRVLEGELSHLNCDIRATKDDIHVLEVEWNFLNDPARLQRLAEKHLGMIILKPEQITMAATMPAMLEALENDWAPRTAHMVAGHGNRSGSATLMRHKVKDRSDRDVTLVTIPSSSARTRQPSSVPSVPLRMVIADKRLQ